MCVSDEKTCELVRRSGLSACCCGRTTGNATSPKQLHLSPVTSVVKLIIHVGEVQAVDYLAVRLAGWIAVNCGKHIGPASLRRWAGDIEELLPWAICHSLLHEHGAL